MWPGKPDLSFKGLITGLKGQILGMRGLILGLGRQWTDGCTKVLLCSTGLCPLRGCCPVSPHSISQSCKAGQLVSHFAPARPVLSCLYSIKDSNIYLFIYLTK